MKTEKIITAIAIIALVAAIYYFRKKSLNPILQVLPMKKPPLEDQPTLQYQQSPNPREYTAQQLIDYINLHRYLPSGINEAKAKEILCFIYNCEKESSVLAVMLILAKIIKPDQLKSHIIGHHALPADLSLEDAVHILREKFSDTQISSLLSLLPP